MATNNQKMWNEKMKIDFYSESNEIKNNLFLSVLVVQ